MNYSWLVDGIEELEFIDFFGFVRFEAVISLIEDFLSKVFAMELSLLYWEREFAQVPFFYPYGCPLSV